ncbi:hypothetical protein [Acinetobacter phage A2.1]|nr:hypothetical protein [Acinetobacter phage P711]WNT46385.1 hypothetical protein [Acinetobacter phage A2.1]
MTNPTLITTPFAENGDKNIIPESVGANPQNATMQAGFPPITQQKISEGGIPPERNDFNGILNLYGQHIVHLNKGLPYEFDQAFADAIGGYPLNARVMLDNGDIVRSTVANNTVNPNVDMAGWSIGLPSSLVTDSSGLNQQEINNNLLGLDGSDYIKYSYLKEYSDSTIGQKLQAATEKTVYLIDYIPKSQRSAIFNGTSVYDASASIVSAVNEAIARDATLVLPQGKVTYSAFPNIKTPKFRIIGAGSNKTTLNYTGTADAFSANAFSSGSPTDQFVNGLFVSGFSITGATFTNGFFGQGFARSIINDIKVNGSTGVDGTAAFRLAGCMLSTFNNLITSYVYGSLPYRGFQLTAGTRAGVSINACSNNLFTSCYAEGNPIGWQLAANGADQNTFINGSPEACTQYGLLVGTNCRYNTFVGIGFENKDAVNGDVSDAGIYSSYLGCYSSNKFLVSGHSDARCLKIDGGYFERLEIQAGARGTVIDRVTVNHWNTGIGGLINNGVDAQIQRVTDSQTGQFISARKPRTSLTVGASPFSYTNTNQLPVKIRVQGGTVTQALVRRGTDSWTEGDPVAAGGGTVKVGIYILMPQESIEISYSAAPAVNLILM